MGGNEIGEEAECLAAAFGGDHHHVAVMAGGAAHPDARRNFEIAIHQRHAAASDERVVILVEVADAVADQPLVGMLPLAARGEVLRARQSRFGAAVRA